MACQACTKLAAPQSTCQVRQVRICKLRRTIRWPYRTRKGDLHPQHINLLCTFEISGNRVEREPSKAANIAVLELFGTFKSTLLTQRQRSWAATAETLDRLGWPLACPARVTLLSETLAHHSKLNWGSP